MVRHTTIFIKVNKIVPFLLSLALGWIAFILQWVNAIGKGFVYTHVGLGVAALGLVCLIHLIEDEYSALQRYGAQVAWCLCYALTVIIALLLAFVATKWWNVNFYVAYLLLTFCQCILVADFNFTETCTNTDEPLTEA